MLVTALLAAIRRWHAARAATLELSKLDDRMRDDLGLARGRIRAYAETGER